MSKCSVRSTFHLKFLYSTLFCPKFWARAWRGDASAIAARAKARAASLHAPALAGAPPCRPACSLIASLLCRPGQCGPASRFDRLLGAVRRDRALGRLGASAALGAVGPAKPGEDGPNRYCTFRRGKVRSRDLGAPGEEGDAPPRRHVPRQRLHFLGALLREVPRDH